MLGVTELSSEEAFARLGGLQVVDVRIQTELDSAHLPKARLLPLSVLAARYLELDARRDTLVYCDMDACSTEACAFLAAHGLEMRLFRLVGGLRAWRQGGFPTQSAGER